MLKTLQIAHRELNFFTNIMNHIPREILYDIQFLSYILVDSLAPRIGSCNGLGASGYLTHTLKEIEI